MSLLHQGTQTPEMLDALIRVRNIRSEAIKLALHDYLVKGHPKTSAAKLNGIPDGNLNRALESLEAAAREVEFIKELDWARFKKENGVKL